MYLSCYETLEALDWFEDFHLDFWTHEFLKCLGISSFNLARASILNESLDDVLLHQKVFINFIFVCQHT